MIAEAPLSGVSWASAFFMLKVGIVVIPTAWIIGVFAGYRSGQDVGRTATILWASCVTVLSVTTILTAAGFKIIPLIALLALVCVISARRLGRENRPPTRPATSTSSEDFAD